MHDTDRRHSYDDERAADLSGTERGGLREQGVGLGERRYRSQPVEQRSGPVESRRSFVRLAEADQAAAVAQKSVGVFGDDAELFPAPGGVGVAVRGRQVVAVSLGQRGGGANEGVLCVWSVRSVVLAEAPGEAALIESDRRPDECW